MKYVLIIIMALLVLPADVVAQETRSKKKAPAVAQPSLEVQQETLQREVQHIHQQIERLRAEPMPKVEEERAIRKARIQELELKKMWKQKELAIAEAESANEDVAGLRGEAKALNERYLAAQDIREELERNAFARQAERDDETAVPNQKIKLQREQLRAQFHQHQADIKREQQSENPDAERIAKLKGELEAIQRQIEELDERK